MNLLFWRKPKVVTTYLKTYPECEFDIEGMSVVSVERCVRRDITVVCFLNPRGKVKEFYLPVSPQAHLALVERFRAKLGLGISIPLGQPPTPIPHS